MIVRANEDLENHCLCWSPEVTVNRWGQQSRRKARCKEEENKDGLEFMGPAGNHLLLPRLHVAVICRGIWKLFSLELHMHLVLDLEKLNEKLLWGVEEPQAQGKPFVKGKSEEQGQCELQPSPGALDQLQIVAAASPIFLLSSCKSLSPVCWELYRQGCLVPLGRWHCVKPLWILFIPK